ncbi:MAG: hypothetical protein KDA80_07980 [Planctomycetaceae bacterium]|nr:hypothetical protein [Planctomycetaceae bacterium]
MTPAAFQEPVEEPEVKLQIDLPIKFDEQVQMPDLSSGPPSSVWSQFFDQKHPRPQVVRNWVRQLHNQHNHKQVIACIEQALIHGQAQPWMYEVLAMSMELEDYPKESIERVILSLSDFGSVDFSTMMFSAAYLAQFERHAAAFRLYQQASQIIPERSEPFVMALELAPYLENPADVSWAAAGVLAHHWGDNVDELHQKAADAIAELIRKARLQGDTELQEQLRGHLAEARHRDVQITLSWNGTADLDLFVEEPNGSVCSFEQTQTSNGGLLLHDGIGTDRDNAHEDYVAPRAFSGPYRVTVKKASGDLVGDRASLVILLHAGTPDEKRINRTLVFNSDEASVSFDLVNGRRQQPKTVAKAEQNPFDRRLHQFAQAQRFAHRDARARQVMQNFAESRESTIPASRRVGAVGYQPVVQLIPEGTSLTGRAVVSPDRRYVRIAIQPTFNNVTDVFTFSIINGAGVGTGN